MVCIYNNEISCQMDMWMNILLIYSYLVVYYVIKALPGLIVTWIIGGRSSLNGFILLVYQELCSVVRRL